MNLVHIINIGYRNNLRFVSVPNTKFNSIVLQALYKGGLISSYYVVFDNPRKYNVNLSLSGTGGSNSKILTLKTVSTPGARQYIKAHHFSRFKSPFFILSTTRGILSPNDFLEDNPHVGGELFFILTNK